MARKMGWLTAAIILAISQPCETETAAECPYAGVDHISHEAVARMLRLGTRLTEGMLHNVVRDIWGQDAYMASTHAYSTCYLALGVPGVGMGSGSTRNLALLDLIGYAQLTHHRLSGGESG